MPPENATGNYVKVTQRLPVRIELVESNPDDTPLFAGLSVVPHVHYKEAVSGPGAGQRLHAFGRLRPPDFAGGPAGSEPLNRDDRLDRSNHDPGSDASQNGGPKVKAPVNHWIVALTVTLATFMEVLDTSIANVALPVYLRRALGRPESIDLGPDQLSRRQRDRIALVRLADGAFRPQAVLYGLCVLIHGELGPLRRGPEHRASCLVPDLSGTRRRRTSAV